MQLYLHVIVFTIILLSYCDGRGDGIKYKTRKNKLENHPKSNQNRSFVVDWDNDQFLKDGQPFRFIAGAFHYYRALPQTWQRKLHSMRSAGLNVVTTYIEWSLQNPKDGLYKWDGIADIERYIQLAAKEGLLVILRPGPYICSERDMGGFPHWLLNKYPNILLRTTDKDYLNEVRIWYRELFKKLMPYLYGNGGPIIMVQIENEYGSFGCDDEYKNWLKQQTEMYVKDNAVLYTNDGPEELKCGKIDGVLATLDFGPTSDKEIADFWGILRKYQTKGPLVCTEYYPGWISHWQETFSRVDTEPVVDSLKTMLDANASVNIYMFYGGTNFGFTSGANDGNEGRYQPIITSYDFDAPLDESGDPTPKYVALREAISHYLPEPNVPPPHVLPKMKLPDITLTPATTLLSDISRRKLGTEPVFAENPLSFEALNQRSGFVLYETDLPHLKVDPNNLIVEKLRDRAHILVDGYLLGILSRENLVNSVPISADAGSKLQILVENQGRIGYNVMNDFKGILGDVRINKDILYNWTITGFPLDDHKQLKKTVVQSRFERLEKGGREKTNREFLREGPTIFQAEFDISLNDTYIYDTYLNPSGWGKGIVFINGFNLGRYWPLVGPQITLYMPKELLKSGKNKLIIIELQSAPDNGLISFSDVADLDDK